MLPEAVPPRFGRRLAVVAHPAAGRGQVGRHLAEVMAALGPADPLLLQTDSRSDAVELLRRAVEADAAGVVAVGGDGTAHLAVQAVAGTSVPLGVVPLGTGNDLADAVGVPADPQAAVQAILADLAAGRTTAIDAVRVDRLPAGGGLQREDLADGSAADGSAADGSAADGSAADGGPADGAAGDGAPGDGRASDGGEVDRAAWFAAILSVGFDSAVNARANRMHWPWGPRRYDVAILAELAHLRTYQLTLDLDGTVVETPAVLAAFGNTRSYGGGMRMCPDADPTDGLLDVTVVGPVSRFELIRVKPRLYSGTHVTHPAVRTYRAASVRVDAPGAFVFADGEPAAPLPLCLHTVPAALRLLGAARHG